MEVEFVKKKRSISETRLAQVEVSLGTALPSEYRSFLLRYNGGKPLRDRFHWKGKSGNMTGSRIDFFLSVEKGGHSNFETYFKRYQGRMPSHIIPIGYDPGGNLICLSTEGKDEGAVYFWDHESEGLVVGSSQPYYDNLRLVAPSFDAFLNSLTE